VGIRLKAFIASAAAAGLAFSAGAGLAFSAGAGTASATPAAPTGWRVVDQLAGGHATVLQSVTAPSKDDAWAVGYTVYGRHASKSKPAFLHWNGSRWRNVTIAGTAGLRPLLVESTSPGDVWIFGTVSAPATDFALHLFDGSWQRLSTPGFSGFAAAVLGGSNVWLTGAINCTETTVEVCTTSLLHWTGSTTWTNVTVPGEIETLTGAGGHVWAAGINNINPVASDLRHRGGGGTIVTGKLTLLQLNHGAWQQFASTQPTISDLGPRSSFALAGPRRQLWVSTFSAKTRGTLRYWNGSQWSDHSIPAYGSGVNTFAASLSDGYGHGIWLGSYLRWTGSRFLTIPLTTTLVQGVAAVPRSASAWGIGQDGRGSIIALYGPVP
jgi:Protein of unknown function (DUF2510)